MIDEQLARMMKLFAEDEELKADLKDAHLTKEDAFADGFSQGWHECLLFVRQNPTYLDLQGGTYH